MGKATPSACDAGGERNARNVHVFAISVVLGRHRIFWDPGKSAVNCHAEGALFSWQKDL